MTTLTNLEYSNQVLTLADFLECDPDEITETSYGYEYGSQEYAVLTDEEADAVAHEYIADSVWAFKAEFLEDMTDIPKEAFEGLQHKCEDANSAILKIIESTCGLYDFCDTAISYDGRGHFISHYDGEEHELNDFYIYRIN